MPRQGLTSTQIGTIVRKTIHVIFSIPLLAPFILPVEEYIQTLTYYTILTVIVSFAYMVYVKRHRLHTRFRDYVDFIRNALTRLTPSFQGAPPLPKAMTSQLEHIHQVLYRVESKLREIVELAERDYERKYSFVGVLMGCLGVLCSYILFGAYTFYGVLAIVVYDSVSAVAGTLIGKVRIPMTDLTLEGCLVAAALFTVVLVLIGVPLHYALLLSLAAIAAEAFGVEDNLAIPLVVSAVAYVLNL